LQAPENAVKLSLKNRLYHKIDNATLHNLYTYYGCRKRIICYRNKVITALCQSVNHNTGTLLVTFAMLRTAPYKLSYY